MHELSVCQALVQQLECVAAKYGGRRVELVRLRVGPLSGVETGLLRQAFPIASAGSVAAGAEMIIEPAPVMVQCRECGVSGEAAPNRMVCGACGGYRVLLVSGDEMMLEFVELETPRAAASAAS